MDIDASNIIFGADFTGRVRFRITFSSPQKASDAEKVEYKRAIETIEFKCPQSQYRVVNLKRFDNKGREVGSNEAKPSLEWKQVKPRTLMERFFKSGCEVINRKKQNP